jgi:class 3 adenylate cyclase/tetratricopeptide (TPR) repeat protein
VISCSRCGEENADRARFCWNCGNPLGAPEASAEVRKTVTVMFMDAVGSTRAGEQTDPESMRRVMTRYFDEIRSIVERHGGTVEKYIGDAVMAVFGVPMVHEDDALRAARAAIQIRSRLADLAQELQNERGISVAWRTGINTGEVVAGDAGAGQRFVSGDAVNVAARLEQAAQAGEILIGSETYPLVRDVAHVEAAPAISAKGKSEPLTAYRLVEVDAGTQALARRLESPLIGRKRQMRLLREAFEQVVDERVCHLFTILGAAGVGKSRLVAEFLTSLGVEAQVLRGRCLSYGEGITFWPLAEAIRDAAGQSEADTDDELRRKLEALIDDDRNRTQVAQRLGELLGRFTGDGTAEEMFWAARTLLESLARRRPIVLLLDDVHWAEPTLLDLIEHLADWTNDAPLLVVCLARRELLEKRPGWGGGKSHATMISLEPLNEAESRELMATLLGNVDFDSGLVTKIEAAAEGNPLFVEEMIGMLIDSGYLKQTDDGYAVVADLSAVAVPPTIQALLAARLDGLPVPERAVIERGAVEGKVFHRGAVAELAPPDLRESLPAYLQSLSRKELVRPDRSDFAGDEAFRFRHLLIRDAAYAAMPKEARADLHARFAAWLTRIAGDHVVEYEEILGYHLEQAHRYRTELGMLDDETRRLGRLAAEHLASAGRRALDRADVHAARKLMQAAVQLLPPNAHERYRCVAEMCHAMDLAGELREADDILRKALEDAISQGDELGAAQVEVIRLSVLGVFGDMAIEDIIMRSEELLEVFEKHDDDWGRERAQFEAARHHFFAGRARVAQDMMRSLISARAAAGQPVWPMMFGMLMASTFWGPAPVGDAIAMLEEMGPQSTRGLESVRVRALGGLRGLIGDFDTGRALLNQSLAIEREIGRVIMADSLLGHFLGPLELAAGRYEAAEALLLEAFSAMSGRGDNAFSSTVAASLADLYVELGRLEDVEHWAAIALDTSDEADVDAQARGRSATARVRAAQTEIEAALVLASEAVSIAEATDYLDLRAAVNVNLAEVLLVADRREEAVAALRRAVEDAEAKGATVAADSARQRLAEIEAMTG